MDSLTQIVLGAAVGEAVLGKKVGNKAALFGAIAGTIPDLDVLARFFTDTVSATELHRGFSHSILFSVLFAPVFGGLVWRLLPKKEANWRNWSWLFFWGLVTHPILDAFTTWGTQLFWPFKTRLAFQNIFVIDPLYTIPFMVLLILALRHERAAVIRRKLNTIGLILSTSYLLLTLILKGFSYNAFVHNLDSQGIAYEQISTRPTPFNTILWTANIDAGDAYLIGNYSFFDSKPIQFKAYPKDHELLGDLAKNDKVMRLIAISEGWYKITEEEEGMFFNDLRFGLMSMDENETKFAFTYKLEESVSGLSIIEIPKVPGDAKGLLASLWKRMQGN